MFTVITILIIIACILLIFAILIQNSKGGGMAANFGMTNQLMGVRRTSDFLEKATWTLAIILLVLSLGINFVIPRGEEGGSKKESAIKEKIDEAPQPFEDVTTGEQPAQQDAQ